MKQHDIGIVILSCDKFNVTWKPCIDHFFLAWPNCPYPVYLLNNFIQSEDNRVIDLLVGEDLNWSDTLKKGLNKIKEERVFFIYDDSFIYSIPIFEVEVIFDIAINDNLESATLRKNPFGKGELYNEVLYKLFPTTKYRNALFLNLIKKEIVLELLKSGENAWQFEKVGNIRSKNLNFYSVLKPDLLKFHHGILKGKWMPNTYNYLKSKGYLTNNTFPILSNFKMFKFEVYTVIFFTLNKLIHLFKGN